jgi:MtN3 and saliva related transmembrane protein
MKLEFIGMAAAILSVVGLLPQVYKSYKTKHTRDISLKWLILSLSAHILWFIYGISNTLLPVMLASSSVCIMTTALIFMKIKK